MKKEIIRNNSLSRLGLLRVLMNLLLLPAAPFMAEVSSRLLTAAQESRVGDAVTNAVVFVLIAGCAAFFRAFFGVITERQAARADFGFRADYLKAWMALPLPELASADYGNVIRNLNKDCQTASRKQLVLIPEMITGILGSISYLAIICILCPQAGMACFLIALLQVIPPLMVKRFMQVNYEESSELDDEITDAVAEAVDGHEAIRLHDLAGWWIGRLKNIHVEYLKVGHKADATATGQRVMFRTLDHVLKYGSYAVIGLLTLHGRCSAATALEIIVLSPYMFQLAKQAFSQVSLIAEAGSAEKRLFEGRSWSMRGPEPGEKGSVVLKDVTASREDKAVLRGVTLAFREGENFLLTGANGSGKTTLLQVMAGMVTPDAGHVEAPGMCLVPQEDPKLQIPVDALLEMLPAQERGRALEMLGRLGFPEDKAHDVCIADLSGGERKKVFLSLGLASDREWLLFDEPTNHLDAGSRETLLKITAERKNCVIVSHDASWLRAVDELFRVEDGHVSELDRDHLHLLMQADEAEEREEAQPNEQE